jgi:hypothetical protein
VKLSALTITSYSPAVTGTHMVARNYFVHKNI